MHVYVSIQIFLTQPFLDTKLFNGSSYIMKCNRHYIFPNIILNFIELLHVPFFMSCMMESSLCVCVREVKQLIRARQMNDFFMCA